jgi:hypothetical protein
LQPRRKYDNAALLPVVATVSGGIIPALSGSESPRGPFKASRVHVFNTGLAAIFARARTKISTV